MVPLFLLVSFTAILSNPSPTFAAINNCKAGYSPKVVTGADCRCEPAGSSNSCKVLPGGNIQDDCASGYQAVKAGRGGAECRCQPINPGTYPNCSSGFIPVAAGRGGADGRCEPDSGTCKPEPADFGKAAVSQCGDVDTAIGTIPTCDLNDFAAWFLGWAMGIGGGIAFLLILLGGFKIMTSGGNPDQIKAGKEQLTSAIAGLFFIIFSVFLLQLIGVQILHIPGF